MWFLWGTWTVSTITTINKLDLTFECFSKWGRERFSKPSGTREPLMACWPTQAIIWEILMKDPVGVKRRRMKRGSRMQNNKGIVKRNRVCSIIVEYFFKNRFNYIFIQPLHTCIHKNIVLFIPLHKDTLITTGAVNKVFFLQGQRRKEHKWAVNKPQTAHLQHNHCMAVHFLSFTT